jgi:hypothetical protein
MNRYAEGTSVPMERSRAEIERVLLRYGASDFAYRTNPRHAEIAFVVESTTVRLGVDFPDANAPEFSRTPTGRVRRAAGAASEAWEAEVRRLWRALSLVIRAKLEAVESGISTFEREFMADIVMKNGHTLGEAILPRLSEAVTSGRLLGDGR